MAKLDTARQGERLRADASARPSRPLRVASVARNWTIGGDERRLHETALAMAAIPSAVEHTVFTLNDTKLLTDEEQKRWGSMLRAYGDAGIEVVELASTVDMRTPRDALEVLRLVRRLASEFRIRGIQVVDARMGLGGLLGIPAAKLARVPVTTLTLYYTRLYEGWFKSVLGQACVAGTDAVISDAQATLDDFADWRLVPRAPLVRIRNGFRIEGSRLDRAAAREALELPFDDDATVVGQVSWIYPRKGWETFIDAAQKVVEVRPDVRFVGVGFLDEGHRWYMEELEARVVRAGLSEHLVWRSYPGAIADVHAAIDVFTHLSLEDSQPMAIHEAMAAGSPTIVSDLSGTVEIVTDGETGLVAGAGSAAEAAKCMLALIDDPARAQELAEAGVRRFRDEHSPENLAESHLRLYRELLAQKAAGGR